MNHQSQHSQDKRFDIVALVGSAGSHAAILTLLRNLPSDFSVPIIVMQHLGPDAMGTIAMYARGTSFATEWVQSGTSLAPHTVLVCPPRSFVDVLPDGTCVVSPCERGALDKPMDRFLESVARSFGERSIAVVLTGMGDDGAAGAAQLHLAGGYVLVQHEASAEQKEMPKAAIAAGAADLVAPLADLGQVLAEVAAGTPRPQARSELAAIARVFGERGEVAAAAREVDWAATPLGSVISWPEELRLIARTALESPAAMAVWWGPHLIQIYNDGWCSFLGDRKHPQALGKGARETWAEIWPQIGPMVERVLAHGEVASSENERLSVGRGDLLEEVFATFSFSPIRDMNGAVVGVHATGWETTEHVVAQRRMRLLRALTAQAAGGGSPREACERAAAALASDPADMPFALLYLLDEGRRQATLAGAAGAEAGAVVAPRVLTIADQRARWPLARMLDNPSAPQPGGVVLDDLAERFPDLAAPPTSPAGTLPAQSALLLPLHRTTDLAVSGVLVAALSPQRPFDDAYRSFLDLVAQQIYAGIVEARARQLERERAERLAELDRAKTEFFANVSHEFRTPLTLMLAPLEDLLYHHDELPAVLVEEVEVATSNARRLLRLVNSLLDFSQIDTRRQHPNIKPTDLGALTSDIASAFRSAIEAAGLRLRIECDPALPAVPVDRDMWEKIVSNLLSNAFKFTFEGEIAVELRALSLHAELVIKDTGIGIPAHELPNLFKRFHRVRGARARTVEGAGIGLAIVDDLVKRLGGQLRVRSTEHHGTEFTIWLPYKSFRIPSEPLAPAAELGAFASELAHEASRWLPDAREAPNDVLDDLLGPPAANENAQRGRIVVVDDNADMREYLQRLLRPRWEVELAANGEAALKAAKRNHADLILADVMMPGLDGFALMERVRNHPELKHTPIVLLTARAGEAAAIQGLLAGADDYIAKPFSPRELVARIQAAVERARAEHVLREREARLQTVLQALPVGVWITDVDGRIIGKNKQSDTIWAGNAPLVEGVDQYHRYQSWDAISGQELETEDFPLTRTLRTGKLVEAEEHRIRRLDGSTGFVLVSAMPISDDEGRLTGAVAINLDITDRKRAAEERERLLASISEYSEKLTTIVRCMTDEVWFADANGTLTLLNPQARTNLGLDVNTGTSVDDVVTALEILHPDGTLRSREDTPLLKSIKGEKVTGEEIIRHRKTGELRYRLFSSTPVTDTKGGIIGAVAISTDITERKRAEVRQAYLLKLSDTLRSLSDANAVKEVAARLIADHLGASQSNYTEYQEAYSVVTRESRNDASISVVGSHKLSDFPATMEILSAGRDMIIPDMSVFPPFTDEERRHYLSRNIQANATVPLVKNNTLVATFSVRQTTPRQWTPGEVELLRETAERTWAVVERAHAEAAQRTSEERLRRVLDGMGEGFGVLAPDFTILEHNREALRMDGRAREEIVGRSHWDVFPGSENSELGRMLKKAMAERVPMSLEHRYAWEADRALWLEMRAYPTADGMLAVFWRDITNRKRVEAALRESEERFRTVTDVVPQVIWANDAEGRANYFNQRWYAYSGLSFEQSAGPGWQAIVHGDDAPAAVERWQQALAAGEVFESEYRLRRSDGAYRWFIGRTVPLRDEPGARA